MSRKVPKRILIKLSGEALLGGVDYGIDPEVINRIAGELRDVRELGVQVAVVIGGGNIFRGAGLAEAGMRMLCARRSNRGASLSLRYRFQATVLPRSAMTLPELITLSGSICCGMK